MPRSHLVAFGVGIVVLSVASCLTAADATAGRAFFEAKIRPVLVKHCYECHSADAKTIGGNLRLDAREHIRTGGDSGAAVVPGNTADSLLLDALRYESLEMPPQGKLADGVIRDFRRWIEMGAPDPRDAAADVARVKNKIDWEASRQFWSFQTPIAQSLPNVRDAAWSRRPWDTFVRARLEEAGLQPNPPADRRTLLRRLHLDVTGLPPTIEEVRRFEQDDSPTAYAAQVERLLASPEYGERWARAWLDIARYGEDQAHIVGNNQALFYPNAFRYRDWLIQAWNADLPYDDFIKLQLAADLLQPDDVESHVALGFLGLGPKYYRRNSPEVMADEWEDRVDTVSRGLLGLTVACARCHDHKYDPISTKDYYALAGVFASTEMFNRPLNGKFAKSKDGSAKKPSEAIHIVRESKPRDLHVFVRGDINSKGPIVPRRFLQILSAKESAHFSQGSGRKELAEAIADRRNPLTARVLVNRVWAGYFGRPLVNTPSNFGNVGERPSHPHLLDYLAVRFMDAGWSMKWLHREILLSATYRQSSRVVQAKKRADPDNLLLWRMNRKRLPIEAWRDSVLACAGVLEKRVGGPSIKIDEPDARRRTVYSKVSRFELNPMLALFDFPDPNVHAADRSETTTPLQKLFVMNSPFMTAQADRFVEQLDTLLQQDTAECVSATRSKVRLAYEQLFAREPTEAEFALALAYLSGGANSQERWRSYAQILLASNELLFVD